MKTLPITKRVKSLTNTRKRNFYFSARPFGTVHNTASFWDSGSKDFYSVLNYKTGATRIPRAGFYPTFDGKDTLGQCEILIQTGTFCGKPATPSITCNLEEIEEVMKYLGI